MDEAVSDDDQICVSQWRQGDFVAKGGEFIFAVKAESPNYMLDPISDDSDIEGFVVVTQTCDLVRDYKIRPMVAVCPLVYRDEASRRDIDRGTKPMFAHISNSPQGTYADLSRVMSVDKHTLASWERESGFDSDQEREIFSKSLERFFGRFAFPDEFEGAIKKFKNKVISRHSKPASPIGKALNDVREFRFCADPHWASNEKAISVIAILEDALTQDRKETIKQVQAIVDQICLPTGYSWSEPKVRFRSLDDFTARDYAASQLADFDFLCD